VRWVVALALLGAAALPACGDDDAGGGSAERPELVVSAASSLTEALETCSRRFGAADVKLSFAGSDELAAQIRQGVRPDVFAAANTALPEELNAEGLLGEPREFVSNTLVVAVPKDSSIDMIEQLAGDGVKLAVGSEGTPIGDYTREVLGRMPPGVARDFEANLRSEEPDVKGIVAKVAQGAADAGFVYASDVQAAADELRAMPLPGELQPSVTYAAGVVDGAPHPDLAARYLEGLVEGDCYDELQRAGFGPLK
jgi:molybdate transport system substrate-binding protein